MGSSHPGVSASRTQKNPKCGNTHFHAQLSFFVFVTTVRLATCDMEARASPRNPYVVRWERSENLDILEVVKRCASIERSDFYSTPQVEWPTSLL